MALTHCQEKNVPFTPIHLAYTTYMRGVDVCDHLRGVYSFQIPSKKWWHKLFFFLVDRAMVNSWMLHKYFACYTSNSHLSHLDFIKGLAKGFMWDYQIAQGVVSIFNKRPSGHRLVKIDGVERKCKFCGSKTRMSFICPGCREVFLHFSSHY